MQFALSLAHYFFDVVPTDSFQYRIIMIVIAAVILAASIFMRVALKKKKEDKTFRKLFRTFPTKLQTVAICLAIYIIARYAKIPFLSMRILFYVILLVACYFTIQNIRIYLKEYPELKKRRLEQIKMNKYLPRKKK